MSTTGVNRFQSLEAEYQRLYQGPILFAEDSDEEFSLQAISCPKIVHTRPLQSSDMTLVTSYCGREVRFKGNQFISWARDMMERVIYRPEREAKISEALASRTLTIQFSDDWLTYEGMFNACEHLPAKQSLPFFGIATIAMTFNVFTTVEFKDKKKQSYDTPLLYAHLHDPILIQYLEKQFTHYSLPDWYGLSYPDVVKAIAFIKTDVRRTDAELATRQLNLFTGFAQEPILPADRFLAYLNAILFGAEASRNSLSFVTGILVLNMIAQEKLTYQQSFGSPGYSEIFGRKKVPYAVYPMTSPYAGKGHFKAYNKLLELSQREQQTSQLSSSIGMQADRKRAQWCQIQLKEAILFKFWSQDWNHPPGWLNASTHQLGHVGPASDHGHAVEFARCFNQSIVSLLHTYFPRKVERLLVYSPDEMYALGGFKPSQKIWKNPEDPTSSETDFKALQWHLSTATPLRLEKDLQDAMWDLRNDILSADP